MENKDLTLFDLFRILQKNIILIIGAMIVFGGLAFGYVKHKNAGAPYTAKSEVVIYNPSQTKYDQNGVYNKEMGRMGTYEQIAQSNVIYRHAQKILDQKGKDYKVSEIKRAVTVKREDQTTVLEVEAKSTRVKDAKNIANATSEAIDKYLDDYINAGKINILSQASLKNVKQDTLSTKKYTAVGLAFGLVVAVLFVLIKDILYVQYKQRK